ncbi:MAG TPA: DMT family transporter [Candidatus Aphodovivens avistercoris]|nr:DMT family transporter [Candidatus Aphodovivens avistercoris]
MAGKGGNAVLLASLAAAVAGASYGLAGTVSQLFAAQGLSVGNITVVQFVASAIILAVPVIVRYHDFPSAKDVLKLLVVGLFQPGSAICYYTAISMLTVGQAVAMQFQYVWIAVVIQCIVERVAPKKMAVASSLLIVFGTIFGSGIADEALTGAGGGLSLLGIAVGGACALCYAVFLYFNGRVATDAHPITRSFIISLSGVALSSVLYPGTYADMAASPLAFVPCGVVMGCLTLLVPVMCLSFAGRSLDGGTVAMLTALELPAAALSGFLVLGDALTGFIVFGIVVILGAVVLSSKADAPSDASGDGAGAGTPAQREQAPDSVG